MLDRMPGLFACGLVLTVGVMAVAAMPGTVRGADTGGARIDMLTGAPAEKLLGLSPARPVVIMQAGEETIALLLATKPEDAAGLRKELLGSAAPPHCEASGPVACCDPQRKTMLLRTTEGWLDYGEACTIPAGAPPEDARQSAAPDVPAVNLDPNVAAELAKRYGDLYDLMLLPAADGAPRILLRKNGTTGRLAPERTPASLLRLAVTGEAPLIVAQATCIGSVNDCNSSGTNTLCHHNNHYWYTRSTGQWCKTPVTCTHAYGP